MLSVHDTVAQKNYDPVLPPMPDDIDEEEDSVKIIRLVKNREPLVGNPVFWFGVLCLHADLGFVGFCLQGGECSDYEHEWVILT